MIEDKHDDRIEDANGEGAKGEKNDTKEQTPAGNADETPAENADGKDGEQSRVEASSPDAGEESPDGGDGTDADDESEELDESFFEEMPSKSVQPAIGTLDGVDVTVQQMAEYDKESIKAIRAEWKRQKKNQRPSGLAFLLLVGVTVFVPWYVYQNRDDIAYFFSSTEPVNLGDAQAYRLLGKGEQGTGVQESFEDNRYSEISGIPIHHIGIQKKENFFSSSEQMLVYEMMGSSVYVQEPMKDSKFASFMSQTSTQFGANAQLEPLKIRGRLRRFDSSDAKRYRQIRAYYSQKYGTVFCEEMSDAEARRKVSLLGQGGIAIQIMPDGQAIQADTHTHATLRDVEALRGRSAMAVGDGNVVIHSIDGGLTWRKSELPIESSISSIASNPHETQIIFGGRNGWIGGESYQPGPESLSISQDVFDISFTDPEPGQNDVPRMIAVGREGLLEVAYMNREGWFPARIDDGTQFNDILFASGRWFAAGHLLMHRSEDATSWTRDVPPVKGKWHGLSLIPGAVVATGSKGAIARFPLDTEQGGWETWPSDDVPGIDYEQDIYASTVSDDGKTWVGVGAKGAIVVAKADAEGRFGPVQRITGSYASYGVVRDILAGNSVEQSLYEALERYTKEDFYDVTYHDGTFYAVGSDSLLMTSKDGLSWHRRQLHVKHKALRAIEFTDDKSGVIGGEKGTMLVTEDNGETWRTRQAPSERSIYDIATSPDYPGGFVFTGAYGLWGFCEAANGKCYLRSSNQPYHYRAIAMDKGIQRTGLLKVLLAGDDARIDHISDAPKNASVKTSLWQPSRSVVHDMAFADEELPLRVGSARGIPGFIAVGDGDLYRTMDAGYTFHREETGMTRPIQHIVVSRNGELVWAFDRQGKAIEDVYGLGQWKPLPDGILDGVITGNQGYIIDSQCIYRKMSGNEPQKLSCVDSPFQLHDITADGNTIVVGVRNNGVMQYAVLENDALVTKGSILPESSTPPGPDANLIVCQGKQALFDASAHQLFDSEGVHASVADVACIQNKLVPLTVQSTKPGIWRVKAGDLWTAEVGFDPTNAKFARNRHGKWWFSTEDAKSSVPLILMSKDGKSWSWRRDRITDFHAVATAGPNAVAVGDNATILVSEDYGESWSQATTNSNQTLRDVCLSSDGSFGIAVGDKGLIYKMQNSLSRWVKLKYTLDFDISSCTIAEDKDRFQVYFAGEGGAIYTAGKEMGKLELISTDAVEDIYSLTTLETGEVIAVGGVYQDPSTVCEDGFIIETDVSPRSLWKTLLFLLVLCGFWGFTVYKLYHVIRRFLSKTEYSPDES